MASCFVVGRWVGVVVVVEEKEKSSDEVTTTKWKGPVFGFDDDHEHLFAVSQRLLNLDLILGCRMGFGMRKFHRVVAIL